MLKQSHTKYPGATPIKVGGPPYNLSGISPTGKVRWQRTVSFLHNVVYSPRYVVYSDHDTVLGLWSPARGGASTLAFLRRSWFVYGRETETGRLLWHRDIVSIGDAVALTHTDEVWTIHLTNVSAYFLHGYEPEYALELHDARTGRLRRAWRLPPLVDNHGEWEIAPRDYRTPRPDANLQRIADACWQVVLTKTEDNGSVLKMMFRENTFDHRNVTGSETIMTYNRTMGHVSVTLKNRHRLLTRL